MISPIPEISDSSLIDKEISLAFNYRSQIYDRMSEIASIMVKCDQSVLSTNYIFNKAFEENSEIQPKHQNGSKNDIDPLESINETSKQAVHCHIEVFPSVRVATRGRVEANPSARNIVLKDEYDNHSQILAYYSQKSK